MIAVINKPPGLTSHDIVEKIRKITGEKRVGHGGTLDPFASGVLVVGISRESTKELEKVLKNTDKEYTATIELGKTSTTGDPEGKITISKDKGATQGVNKDQVENVLAKFIGEIKQSPPAYSAIKIRGTPAYKYARAGKRIPLKKRTVTIKELKILDFNSPVLKLRITASSGTYIRSLAEDIGEALGVGAYLKELTRTRVGSFTLQKSIKIDELGTKNIE